MTTTPLSIPGAIAVLNYGYVVLVDTMGDDRTAAQCARTSFHNANAPRSVEDDAKLTRYLVTHRHTTPLEFCQLRVYMKLPIFVARQLIRHRTASVNEMSLRYVTAVNEFYVPNVERCQRQSTTNKQGSAAETVDDPATVRAIIQASGDAAYAQYERLLELGLSKELARTVLPLGTYTEWYWQTDLHNFLHMCKLRLDPHAQYEIRVYAQAMLDLARGDFPTAIAAWEDTAANAR